MLGWSALRSERDRTIDSTTCREADRVTDNLESHGMCRGSPPFRHIETVLSVILDDICEVVCDRDLHVSRLVCLKLLDDAESEAGVLLEQLQMTPPWQPASCSLRSQTTYVKAIVVDPGS